MSERVPSGGGSRGAELYKTHPTQCDPKDYWGQVRRTLQGKPVGEDQIALIVQAMADAMDLQVSDKLLDLCCGNGALTTRWFAACQGGLGVDFSPALIEVARRDFVLSDREDYLLDSVIDFVQRPGPSQAFTKAICYGSAQYLDLSQLEAVLVGLRKNHLALQRVVLGNLPDRDREPLFRRGEQATPMDDADSDIGLWWSPADLRVLAERTGWALEVRRMPEAFYAHHYRFDAVLRPFGGPT